jgi:hypothetical protein
MTASLYFVAVTPEAARYGAMRRVGNENLSRRRHDGITALSARGVHRGTVSSRPEAN